MHIEVIKLTIHYKKGADPAVYYTTVCEYSISYIWKMSKLFHSVVLLLVCTQFTSSKVHYYVTPSRNILCPQHHCMTLSQIAAEWRSDYRRDTELSLFFLPGNHTLDNEFSVAHIDSFLMTRAAKLNEAVFVECVNTSAKFSISQTRFASMKGLHFNGCGSNTITQVEHFIAEDTTFQGVESGGTALILLKVTSARIMTSSFLFNFGNNNEYPIEDEIVSDLDTVDYLYQENASLCAGGAIFAAYSNVSVDTTTFVENVAEFGGAVFAHYSSLQIVQCTYTNNRAIEGGVMAAFGSSLYIENSTFSGNMAEYGGVVLSENSILTFNCSRFINNSVVISAGVMDVYHSFINITNSTLSNNFAGDTGGVIYAHNSTFSVRGSTFFNNSATFLSGVMETVASSITLINCNLTYNNAGSDSGVMWCEEGSVNIVNNRFSNNAAKEYGGVILSNNCSIHAADSTFENNLGSFNTFLSKVSFSGHTKFKNCAESPNKIYSKDIATYHEGGAITSTKSIIVFTGVSSFSNNQARKGGAILATDSLIVMHGQISIVKNMATDKNGGGIHLQQSILEIRGNCLISANNAISRGGGIHAHSSYVTVYSPAVLRFINNSAQYGGAMSLEVNPKLHLWKNLYHSFDKELLSFTDNHANYGGAIYIADETNSDACSRDFDCFFQVLIGISTYPTSIHMNIIFNENTAVEQGSNLFGGLLDRCIPSPFAEIYRSNWVEFSAIAYLKNISNITIDSIASLPVHVCFCTSDGQPNCSYQPPPTKIKKGKMFTISLAAVDQVGNSVNANITSSLALPDGGLGEGQHSQSVTGSCTNLTFNVFSPHELETITLYADGPCGGSAPSTRHLDIQFLNCSCPIGLKPSTKRPTACECICDKELSPYVANCTTQLLLLRGNNSAWISYINGTDPHGYIIHQDCPYDYCHSSNENISIDLNLPNGADTQCAYNRIGVLCGSCQKHLSLSLGSSRCLCCHSYWPVTFVVILLASTIAGILLVATLLVLNMTVAVGLINSFIFYANIVGISGMVFPSSEPSFPTVFIAWLNLDIGVDVCFLDGLDAYTKTWLQLAFPVYIISLVVVVIVVSEYSPRFAGLIGKKDPIATLATLILLSYAKLLSITITALSYARLYLPDGSRELVWLPDGNIKYLEGKHIALTIVASFIVLIGLPYTLLLFLWQWLVRAPKGKVVAWTRNTKLNVFIAAYHAPYNSKYRYWTGLLLLVRVVLYITSSLTICGGPKTSLVTTIILVGCLFLLKGLGRVQVYKKLVVDVIETGLYFNLLALTALSLYDYKTDITQQTTVAYASVITTLLLLVGVVIYHFVLLIDKEKVSKMLKKNPKEQFPEQPTKSKVTHSIIEISELRSHPETTGGIELDTFQETQDRTIITPPYQQ